MPTTQPLSPRRPPPIQTVRKATMPSPNEGDAIRITTDDLAGIVIPETAVSVPTVPPPGAKVYGTINETAEQFVTVPTEKASILLQGWFYLGIAGMLGALAGWAIAEPGFADGVNARSHATWGNIILIPLIVTMMCIGFGISESIVERSVRKALLRGALALPLGIILGFIFDMMAEIIYATGMRLAWEAGAQSMRNPALWIVR